MVMEGYHDLLGGWLKSWSFFVFVRMENCSRSLSKYVELYCITLPVGVEILGLFVHCKGRRTYVRCAGYPEREVFYEQDLQSCVEQSEKLLCSSF